MKRKTIKGAALSGKNRKVRVNVSDTLISDEIIMRFDPNKTYVVEADMGPGGTVEIRNGKKVWVGKLRRAD